MCYVIRKIMAKFYRLLTSLNDTTMGDYETSSVKKKRKSLGADHYYKATFVNDCIFCAIKLIHSFNNLAQIL